MTDSSTAYEEIETSVLANGQTQLSQYRRLTEGLEVVATALGGTRDALARCVRARSLEFADYIVVETDEEFNKAMAISGKLIDLVNMIGTIEEAGNLSTRYIGTEDGQKIFRGDGPITVTTERQAVDLPQEALGLTPEHYHRINRALSKPAQHRYSIWTAIGHYAIEPAEPFSASKIKNIVAQLPGHSDILSSQVSAELYKLQGFRMIRPLPGRGHPIHVRINPEAWEFATEAIRERRKNDSEEAEEPKEIEPTTQ